MMTDQTSGCAEKDCGDHRLVDPMAALADAGTRDVGCPDRSAGHVEVISP